MFYPSHTVGEVKNYARLKPEVLVHFSYCVFVGLFHKDGV